jgi:hypothetical protein
MSSANARYLISVRSRRDTKTSYFPINCELLPVLHLDARLGVSRVFEGKMGITPLTNLTDCCPNLINYEESNQIKVILIQAYSNLGCYTESFLYNYIIVKMFLCHSVLHSFRD